MEQKRFSKNDSGFICSNCGKTVEPLGVSSRNHCPHCLHSLHVDVFPGDRQNDCMGLMKPFNAVVDSKKGVVILFKCAKCGYEGRNKSAHDDNFSAILQLQKNQKR